MDYYNKYLAEVDECMKRMEVTYDGNSIDNDAGVLKWAELTRKLYESESIMYFVGNGASSMMAGHMSADANKNGKIKSMTFNETSIMTAVSNDISYEEVFAFQVSKFGKKGDVLVTISSSGNSPNIVKAIEAAKEKGMTVVTLSGLKENNKSKSLGNLNFYVPASTYGIVEVAHQALLHCWLDRYLDVYEGGRI